jgi:hypothetical protein
MAGTLKLKSGDTENLFFTFKDSDGEVIDISGATLRFSIKEKLSDANADAVYYTTWTTHTDPVNGESKLAISETITATWTPGEYMYQLRVIDTANDVSSTDVGPCIIQENLLDDE